MLKPGVADACNVAAGCVRGTIVCDECSAGSGSVAGDGSAAGDGLAAYDDSAACDGSTACDDDSIANLCSSLVSSSLLS